MGRKRIGFLVNQLISAYTMEMIRGATMAAEDHDIDLYLFSPSLLVISSKTRQNISEKLRNILYIYGARMRLDAYVLATDGIRQSLERDQFQMLMEELSHQNCIFLENKIPGRESLCAAQEDTTRMLVRHLTEFHHYTRIGCLRGPEDSVDANIRYDVIREELLRAGLPFDETYVRTGDFDMESGGLIRDLLSAHPDLQAVICGNDYMAIGAGRTLREMGLIPGKDVAVTGYDNVTEATHNDPPLTTVESDIYTMGYEGVMEALRMAEGRPRKLLQIPAKLCVRGSCGCPSLDWNVYEGIHSLRTYMPFTEQNLTSVAEEIYDYAKGRAPSEQRRSDIVSVIRSALAFIYRCSLCPQQETVLRDNQERMLEKLHQHRISLGLFQEKISEFAALLSRQIQDAHVLSLYNEKRVQIFSTMAFWQENRVSDMLKDLSEDMFKTLSISDIVIMEGRDGRTFLDTIGETLLKVGVKDCELLRFPKQTEVVGKDGRFQTASTVYEALRIRDSLPIVCDGGKAQKLEHVVQEFCADKKPGMPRIVFLLQHDADQFGMLLARFSESNYVSLFLAAHQIGSALKSLMLEQEHIRLEKQLEGTVRTITEKNEILERVSLYDPLTHIFNRRGLIQSIRQMVKENQGRQGMILFLDLDNLKQINDRFGHNAGDFALKSFAHVLTTALRKRDVVGRFGGDEFLAMVVDDGDLPLEQLPARIREALVGFNEDCPADYYIEGSIGFTTFVCREEPNLEYLFDHADTFLYLDKQNKRSDVGKGRRIG